ncbi:Acyl dehydratase [Sinosporangium album]|uniref:Acyl dehydratase n=1 Tax=Sinosporangium album TaxID=504805 RepID=A0A1G8A803_9ACTN|nr:MaoC family dehydratase N-terminal domain-containing protein [Sinosporangium album]SDH16987.1 Acyl dehydratase [Sinosporangium album]
MTDQPTVETPAHRVTVDEPRVLRFLRAVGDDPAGYTATAAASNGGLGRPTVPPTYLYCLEEMERGQDRSVLDAAGAPKTGALHAAQRFRYHRRIVVGETLSLTTRLAGRYPRAPGTVRLAVLETRYTDMAGLPVADLRCSLAFPAPDAPNDGAAPTGPPEPAPVLATGAIPPATRESLAAYSEASGDRNPIHLDSAAARAEGLEDVIGHGMHVMARAVQSLEGLGPGTELAEYEMRFLALIRLGIGLTVTVHGSPGGNSLRVRVTDEAQRVVALGTARTRRVNQEIRTGGRRPG